MQSQFARPLTPAEDSQTGLHPDLELPNRRMNTSPYLDLTKRERVFLSGLVAFYIITACVGAGYYYRVYTHACAHPSASLQTEPLMNGTFRPFNLTIVALISSAVVKNCDVKKQLKMQWMFAAGLDGDKNNFMVHAYSQWVKTPNFISTVLEIPWDITFQGGRQAVRFKSNWGTGCDNGDNIPLWNGTACNRCYPNTAKPVFFTCPNAAVPSTAGVFIHNDHISNLPNCTQANIESLYVIPSEIHEVPLPLEDQSEDQSARWFYPVSYLSTSFPGGRFIDLTAHDRVQAITLSVTKYYALSYDSPVYSFAATVVSSPNVVGVDLDVIAHNPNFKSNAKINFFADPNITVVREVATTSATQAFVSWFTAVHSITVVFGFFFAVTPAVPMHFRFGRSFNRYKDRLFRECVVEDGSGSRML